MLSLRSIEKTFLTELGTEKRVFKGLNLDINNGLAEGFVNKLKTIKRSMYGKATFQGLRRKILWAGAVAN